MAVLPWAAEPSPEALQAAVPASAWDPGFPSGISGKSPCPCAVYHRLSRVVSLLFHPCLLLELRSLFRTVLVEPSAREDDQRRVFFPL